MRIIDMHSHILPGVDDGAKTFEEAVNMLKLSYNDGVRKIICTPHYHIGRVIADREKCLEGITKLKEVIDEAKVELELYLGNEIYYHTESVEDVASGEIMSLAGSSYILFEFVPGVDISVIHKAVNDAFMEGYTPIIAHFERYGCLVNKPDRCKELKEMGALLQVNASSVIGKSGFADNERKLKKFIKGLMKKQLISFVASDAHGDSHRIPEFRKCYKYVVRKFGKAYAQKIFYDNQEKILSDQVISS